MRIQRGSLVCVKYNSPDRTHKKHRMYRIVLRVTIIAEYVYLFVNKREMLIRYNNTWTYVKHKKDGEIKTFPVKSVEGVQLPQ